MDKVNDQTGRTAASIELFDTHCHIHFPDYGIDPDEAIDSAREAGVTRLLCVGCSLSDSKLGVDFARRRKNVWATIGLHPHEASVYVNDHGALQQFRELASEKEVVAIGETGLDYHYMHSSKKDQQQILRFQLTLASELRLPLVLHIRSAFDDFWPIFDKYPGLTGVVHSFSSVKKDVDNALQRGLYIGLNGIMTFTRDEQQLAAAKAVPLDRLLLETDAPFLTPRPFRGKICEPKHVRVTAEFLSELRNESLEQLAAAANMNARKLFKI